MALFSAQELLRRHGIEYVNTRSGSYTTNCNHCNGKGYLNVRIEKDRVAWFCHFCDEGGAERFEQGDGKSDGLGPITAVYDYTDEQGELLFQALRFEPLHGPKQFRQRKDPDQKPWSVKGVRIVPFRLPDLLAEIANENVIFVVEGEKDVLTLRKHGIPATCNPMGAGKWWPEFNTILANCDVVIIGDNDEPGRNHVALVASNLLPVAHRVRVLDLAAIWPGIGESDDVSDWFSRGGGTVEELWRWVEQLPNYSPVQDQTSSKGKGNGHDHGHAEQEARPHAGRLVYSSAEFVADFVPPDYVLDGILQRRFFYAFTGRTGHGKTAVVLLIAASIALGRQIGKCEVTQGGVLYFAGENPDDVRMRWIAMAQQMDFDLDQIPVSFITGRFKISAMRDRIMKEIKESGEVVFVVIDTSAAYFEGDEPNNNAQQIAHALRLRSLTDLPGGPCVVANCHPIKNATQDQLIPYGGGGYVNECDGNLTCWKTDTATEMHWLGKFRGPDFAPLTFMLRTVTHERLKDSKGRLIPTVVASQLSETDQEALANVARSNEDKVLALLADNGKASQAELAKMCGWFMKNGDPYKSMVSRIIKTLTKDKLIVVERDAIVLTAKGRKAVPNGSEKK